MPNYEHACRERIPANLKQEKIMNANQTVAMRELLDASALFANSINAKAAIMNYSAMK